MFEILEYTYMKTFQDKIYVSKFKPELRVKVLQSIESGEFETNNHNLAGDIEKELVLACEAEDKFPIGEFLYLDVKNELLRHMNNLAASIKNIDVGALWVNFQKPTEYNPSHSHGGDFSFVWYLDIPDEIRQEHTKQKSNQESWTRGLIEFQSQHTNDKHKLNPQTDDFLLFRSDHLHQVYPFYSDNTRISVSGNITVKE